MWCNREKGKELQCSKYTPIQLKIASTEKNEKLFSESVKKHFLCFNVRCALRIKDLITTFNLNIFRVFFVSFECMRWKVDCTHSGNFVTHAAQHFIHPGVCRKCVENIRFIKEASPIHWQCRLNDSSCSLYFLISIFELHRKLNFFSPALALFPLKICNPFKRKYWEILEKFSFPWRITSCREKILQHSAHSRYIYSDLFAILREFIELWTWIFSMLALSLLMKYIYTINACSIFNASDVENRSELK